MVDRVALIAAAGGLAGHHTYPKLACMLTVVAVVGSSMPVPIADMVAPEDQQAAAMTQICLVETVGRVFLEHMAVLEALVQMVALAAVVEVMALTLLPTEASPVAVLVAPQELVAAVVAAARIAGPITGQHILGQPSLLSLPLEATMVMMGMEVIMALMDSA